MISESLLLFFFLSSLCFNVIAYMQNQPYTFQNNCLDGLVLNLVLWLFGSFVCMFSIFSYACLSVCWIFERSNVHAHYPQQMFHSKRFCCWRRKIQLKWMLRQKMNAVGISSPERKIPSDRRHCNTPIKYKTEKVRNEDEGILHERIKERRNDRKRHRTCIRLGNCEISMSSLSSSELSTLILFSCWRQHVVYGRAHSFLSFSLRLSISSSFVRWFFFFCSSLSFNSSHCWHSCMLTSCKRLFSCNSNQIFSNWNNVIW